RGAPRARGRSVLVVRAHYRRLPAWYRPCRKSEDEGSKKDNADGNKMLTNADLCDRWKNRRGAGHCTCGVSAINGFGATSWPRRTWNWFDKPGAVTRRR